jgi:peptidoglycan/LPS O-acetylase OafA/YrhL
LHIPFICSVTSYLLLINHTSNGKLYSCLFSICVLIVISFYFTKYISLFSISI